MLDQVNQRTMYSIIGNGFVGSVLYDQLPHNQRLMYDRNNISNLHNINHDIVIVCAPTGNRLRVSQDSEQDFNDCRHIVQSLENTNFKHIVHISTVDTVVDTPYGRNRLWLETQIKNYSSTIVRLPSLIHPNIQKNILFDLANKLWLDKISLESTIQWYPLQRLARDINWAVTNGMSELNLVSRPISNRELVSTVAPALLTQLDQNQVNPSYYNLKSINNGYWILDKEVWHNLIECFLELKQKQF